MWLEINGRRVWSQDVGRKICTSCWKPIRKEQKRSAYAKMKYCSTACKRKEQNRRCNPIIYTRRYYEKNKELVIKRANEYRKRLPKDVLKQMRAEYQRRYRSKHRDKINAKRRIKRQLIKLNK